MSNQALEAMRYTLRAIDFGGEQEIVKAKYLLSTAIAHLESAPQINQQLVEALKVAGLFIHHCWCDVQMNDYSLEKLENALEVVDAALAKWEGKQ